MIMRMLFTIFVFSCLVLPVPALCQDNGQDNEEKAAGVPLSVSYLDPGIQTETWTVIPMDEFVAISSKLQC